MGHATYPGNLCCGISLAAARSRAAEGIIRIEGSPILSRALDDKTAFELILKSLPDLLTSVN
jgi:hypothetical protein